MTQLFVTWIRRPVRTLDRGTRRSAGFVCLLVVVFLTVNTSVAHAATDGPDSAGLLAPLNIYSSEGVPLDGYQLNANGGSILSYQSQALTFVLSGLFTIIRILVGLACWAVEFAFRFPLLRMLSDPAQKVSDAYEHAVVDTLGLKALLLGWAFVFGLVMFMRGKVGKGLGEIVATLLIAAFAASAFVRPDYLLSSEGPLVQTQQAASEVAQTTVSSYNWGGKITSANPCADMAGPSETKCQEREAGKQATAADLARPIQESVTNSLVVKPFMLLQYGRILDPNKASDQKAYAVHIKLISGGYQSGENENSDKDVDPKTKHACGLLKGPAHEFCINGDAGAPSSASDDSDVPPITAPDALLGTLTPVLTKEDQQFTAALADFQKAGPVGKACAEYAQEPTWSRVGGAVLLGLAALMICAMLLSAAMVLLGAQATNVAAAVVGVVALVLGMLPGPSRLSVWKWLSLFAVSMLSTFAISMFLPAFAIAVDAILTNGPDLMIERILLLDVLALGGLAFQRKLRNGITLLGHRIARTEDPQPSGPRAIWNQALAEARAGLAPVTLGVQAGRRVKRGANRVWDVLHPPLPTGGHESGIAHDEDAAAAAGGDGDADGAGGGASSSRVTQRTQDARTQLGRP
ncbi:hypothetical protein OG894_43290 (plasmid) [Streptomyces sp. NBC_01724]|uniref:hypothetical protein n=1 Tax=Streptomyces sp. NBC_01724 TaxID=2975922 RepID=UPI002E336162|nr:hypothetical protein [Streptomyces sp. NBC_01724]